MNMPHSKVFDHITSNLRYHDFYKIETTLAFSKKPTYKVLFHFIRGWMDELEKERCRETNWIDFQLWYTQKIQQSKLVHRQPNPFRNTSTYMNINRPRTVKCTLWNSSYPSLYMYTSHSVFEWEIHNSKNLKEGSFTWFY